MGYEDWWWTEMSQDICPLGDFIISGIVFSGSAARELI
jgi:hypothetical protein